MKKSFRIACCCAQRYFHGAEGGNFRGKDLNFKSVVQILLPAAKPTGPRAVGVVLVVVGGEFDVI